MSIKISPKHGLNPMIPVCFFCGKEKQEIVFFGKVDRADSEVPMKGTIDYEPCDECKEKFKQGILLVEVSTEPSVKGQFPITEGIYPTGRWYVVDDKYIINNIKNEDAVTDILKKRRAFIEPGLVREKK